MCVLYKIQFQPHEDTKYKSRIEINIYIKNNIER